jgi:D-glycero-D-manno-heptose 1,7-bisphosphate phosphatase
MINKKIKNRQELESICINLKSNGRTIGFTSGAFDIFHYGHASYLEQAKSKCDFLIVAVNSDSSVRLSKGPNRPIISEQERSQLIASLECVDYVFVFSEKDNKENILSLKPNFYIKGGDYSKSNLKSAAYMEEWGGEVCIIPFESGLSSSIIIDRIKSLDNEVVPECKAVFLDRDGVLNDNISFLHEPDKLKILPGVIEGLKQFKKAGFKLIIVTNQQGIGLGYYTKEDFFKVNSKMLSIFHENGIVIDKIYFCPHSVADNCKCRKPNIGMFIKAKSDLNIDMNGSFMIGDSSCDIEAGNAAGVKTILISKDSKTFGQTKLVSNFELAVSFILN